MTSVAGSKPTRALGSPGFTMIELMIVIGLIVFLMGLLVFYAKGLRQKGRIANTTAMLQRIDLHLDEYKSKTTRFPPDGLGSETVETDTGTPLQSGAALAFALVLPVKLYDITPAGERKPAGISDPIGDDFGEAELYRHPDDKDAVELLDAWGNPLHYDDLSGGRQSYNIQDTADVHLMMGFETHGVDPRELDDCVLHVGPQKVGMYDVWSHGVAGHASNEDPVQCISSFAKKDG